MDDQPFSLYLKNVPSKWVRNKVRSNQLRNALLKALGADLNQIAACHLLVRCPGEIAALEKRGLFSHQFDGGRNPAKRSPPEMYLKKNLVNNEKNMEKLITR